MPKPNLSERRVTASVGISSQMSAVDFSNQEHAFGRLIRESDQAVYRAKQGGRSTHRFFSQIKAKFGLVLERHRPTDVVCVDIGESVGTQRGDEFVVYHPDFTGEKEIVVSDGRSSRSLGSRPRIPSGRIEVFAVQDSISFARIVEEVPALVVQEGAHIEFVPLGTIRTLLSVTSEPHVEFQEPQLLTDMWRAYRKREPAKLAIVLIVDESQPHEHLGTARVNDALGQVKSKLEGMPGLSGRTRRLDTWSYGAILRSREETDAFGENLFQELASDFGVRVRVAIGIVDLPVRGREDSPVDCERLLSRAKLAAQLSQLQSRHFVPYEASIFLHLLHCHRRNPDKPSARRIYAAALEHGEVTAAIENQIALVELESKDPDTQVAIDHLRRALELEPDNAAMAANLGYALYTDSSITEAAAWFRQAMERDYDLGRAYMLASGSALLQDGRAQDDEASVQQGRDILQRALDHKNISGREKAIARSLLQEDAR